jgi:hypothetical protein
LSTTKDDEAPSTLASIGRGYMDIIEPLRQGFEYLWSGPEAGKAYREKKRAELELYRRGLLSDPTNPFAFDPWRVVGRTAVGAPFLGGGATIGAALHGNMMWETIDTARRAYELYSKGLLAAKPINDSGQQKYEALAKSMMASGR